MAEQQFDQDKTEKATPYKLRDAKKRGQVSKSLELNSLLLLAIGFLFMTMLGTASINELTKLCGVIFAHSHDIVFEPEYLLSFIGSVGQQVLHIFWPFMAAVLVVAIAANMSQTGPVFSFFPIKPDFNRLNPVAGFKRVFSKKLLFEALKNIVKLALFSATIYLFMVATIPSLIGALDIDPDAYPLFLIKNSQELAGKLLMVFLIVALLDLMYTRWDYFKKMMMSRRELKEEVKRRDGDPHIKARQRELQKEAARRSGSLQRVPEADVLITNPTHLSVAIKYERGVMRSPEVIAKGAGELALKMKVVAKNNNIPVIENKKLARFLFKSTGIREPIPEQSFPEVAKILVWVYARKNGRFEGAKI